MEEAARSGQGQVESVEPSKKKKKIIKAYTVFSRSEIVSSKTSQGQFKCLKRINEIHILLYYLDIRSSCTKGHLL
jgi:hypothetical protein